MKQKVLIAVTSGIIWFVAGNAFWYLASPLWIDVEGGEPTQRSEIETIGQPLVSDVIHA